MSIARELKQLQKKWKKSKAKASQEPVPDNNYQVRIIDCRLERSKNSNRLQVAQTMQVLNGKFKDRIIYRYSGIETAESLGYLKGELRKLDIKVPKNIINLTRTLEEIIGIDCDITVKTKGGFTNTYINSRAEDDIDEDEEDEDEDGE